MLEFARQRFDHEAVIKSLGVPYTLEDVSVTDLDLSRVLRVREPVVDRVRDLAIAYASGDDVPPIILASDKTTVIDGGHRVTAILKFSEFVQEPGKKPPSKLKAYVLQVEPTNPLFWWYILAFNVSPKDTPVPLKFSNISRALKEYFLGVFEQYGKDSEEVDGIVKEVKKYVKKYGWPPQVVDNAYDAAIAEVIYQTRREKGEEKPLQELLPSPEAAKKVLEEADRTLEKAGIKRPPEESKTLDDPATLFSKKLGVFISSVLELWRKSVDLKTLAARNGMSSEEAYVMFWFHAKGRGITNEVFNAMTELSDFFNEMLEYGKVS